MIDAMKAFNKSLDACAVAIGRELLPEVRRLASAMPKGMKDGELAWPSRWSSVVSWVRYRRDCARRWLRHQGTRMKRWLT